MAETGCEGNGEGNGDETRLQITFRAAVNKILKTIGANRVTMAQYREGESFKLTDKQRSTETTKKHKYCAMNGRAGNILNAQVTRKGEMEK